METITAMFIWLCLSAIVLLYGYGAGNEKVTAIGGVMVVMTCCFAC